MWIGGIEHLKRSNRTNVGQVVLIPASCFITTRGVAFIISDATIKFTGTPIEGTGYKSDNCSIYIKFIEVVKTWEIPITVSI